MNLKEQLYQQCMNSVDQRLKTVQQTIQSHQQALSSETKSSAGDKHETGRAMVQLEMEKASQQLTSILQMRETLMKINPSKSTTVVSLGSLVETLTGTYFLCVSVGQLVVEGKTYFAISTESPIGKLLLGKKATDQVTFNKKVIQIVKIL